MSLVYRFERADFEAGDLYFCVNFGVCDPFTVRGLPQGYYGLAATLYRAVTGRPVGGTGQPRRLLDPIRDEVCCGSYSEGRCPVWAQRAALRNASR